MDKRFLASLSFLLLISLASAEFLTERVDVLINDIKEDGSAHVHESIKFIMYGDYANSLYDSGVSNNELSFWSTNIGLKDVKFHVNPVKVDIRDLRLRPQPRTKCNPIQGICHGELILDYYAYPSPSDNSTVDYLPNTGLFKVEKYKPRTMRYSLNPSSLAFTTTPEGDVILDKDVYLTIEPPQDSVMLDINPMPQGTSIQLPSHIDSIFWNDIVLVKFSLLFEVEDSIDKEVSDFFGDIVRKVSGTLASPQGLALLAIIAIIIGSYLYITMTKRRSEE